MELVVTPAACLLLALTVFGAPLAASLFALYILALLLAGVFVADWIGAAALRRLGRPGASAYARLAAGALVIALCSLHASCRAIPVVPVTRGKDLQHS